MTSQRICQTLKRLFLHWKISWIQVGMVLLRLFHVTRQANHKPHYHTHLINHVDFHFVFSYTAVETQVSCEWHQQAWQYTPSLCLLLEFWGMCRGRDPVERQMQNLRVCYTITLLSSFFFRKPKAFFALPVYSGLINRSLKKWLNCYKHSVKTVLKCPH